jgi:anaerobic ribonucleoside-triphosphate reductase
MKIILPFVGIRSGDIVFKNIEKRDGRLVRFDTEKITTAIAKAGAVTGEFDYDIAQKLTLKVLNLAQQAIPRDVPTVEEIQDVVEEILLSSPYRKTAKAYIIYREQHAGIREITARANVDLVDQYLEKIDWQVNENSNMTFSLQGLNNYVSSEISKIYWLIKIYPPEIRQAHLNGDFHIHDLNLLSVYCVGWDLFDLLVEGFKGAPGKIESKPAKHLHSALGQVVNFFYTLQGEAAGAQAFSNFDTLLAPLIRYDRLSYKEVKQALQEFVFNLNVPTRVGFQTPFTNITLDLTVPEYYADQGVIIGGKLQHETYKDFQAEMALFNRAFLEVMAEGDAKGRVFTFPIPTYNISKDFNWSDSNLESLWLLTAKYGVPYFSNFINSDMNPEDARSMCCRLRIDNRALEVRGGGLFGSNPLTGSIGVVTINMARLGFFAKDEDEFITSLERVMVLAKESLEIKRGVLEKFTEEKLYPYTKFYLRSVKERFAEYWKNHFSTIGLLGMNEACLNLLGEDIASDKTREFSVRVLDFMREKLLEFQEETGNNYNLEATPAEGTSYRLARIDKEKNTEIICANEGEYKAGAEPFYTNSTQLPVNYTDDVFEALELQDVIQTKYTGGTVVHIFAGERVEDPDTIKGLIRKVCESYRLPYFTFTPTFSVCPSHGYIAGEHYTCPECDAETEVYSRVVGYLRPVNQWNKGKREEFRTRKTFVVEPVQPHEIGVKGGTVLDSSTKTSKAVAAKGNYGAVGYKQLDLISFSDDVDESE